MSSEPDFHTIADATMTTGERRAGLVLRVATELYVASDHHLRGDQATFSALAGDLLAKADRADRQAVAELLRPCKDAPHDLVVQLAGDEISVAGPILESSPLLRDSDLVSLIAVKGDDHRALIAQRPSLGPDVVEAILASGARPAIRALAANAAIAFDREIVDALVGLAESDTVLANALALRCDIDGARLAPYFHRLNRPARLAVAEALAGAPVAPDAMVGRAVDTAERVSEIGALAAMIRQRDHHTLADILSQRLDLPEDLAMRICRDDSGEVVIVALRALGFSEDLISRVLLRGPADWSHSVAVFRQLTAFAATLSQEAASGLLSVWRGDTARAGTHQPQLVARKDERAVPRRARQTARSRRRKRKSA